MGSSLSNSETEEKVCVKKCIPPPLFSYSRVVSKSVYFSENYSQYLCFSVFCSTNKLVLERNKHLWSEEQQKTHDLIKSLHDSGMGYRKISNHLNEQGIRTSKGNLWGNNNVHSVLKRRNQRNNRIEKQRNQRYPIEIGTLKLNHQPMD